jgi:hypothetical protein
LQPGDTFVLLDAGGGTVDAITYIVDKPYPLKLKREVVRPEGEAHIRTPTLTVLRHMTGDFCGSIYLNEAFQELLINRLEGEDYLEENGITIRGIVDAKVVEFENVKKRYIDVTGKSLKGQNIFIQGLRPNKGKRFLQNRLQLSR